MTTHIKDAEKTHWVYRMPEPVRPYLQLARYDRPVGFWLLGLPGWIGIAFATLSHGFAWTDLWYGALMMIGAVAMRGAGCTYNDIVDKDLDAQVDRTALRPIPAGTVTLRQAWIWLFIQCFAGLAVLLCLPRLAQIVALCSIPMVAAYPFMKRITWWPQVWLGLTFNWAVLVAYAAKTGSLSWPLVVLYVGLIFWTVGYDTIYACQDSEDDAFVGIKSTARRFGQHISTGVGVCFALSTGLAGLSGIMEVMGIGGRWGAAERDTYIVVSETWKFLALGLPPLLFGGHLLRQYARLNPADEAGALRLFISNRWAGIRLTIGFLMCSGILLTP